LLSNAAYPQNDSFSQPEILVLIKTIEKGDIFSIQKIEIKYYQ